MSATKTALIATLALGAVLALTFGVMYLNGVRAEGVGVQKAEFVVIQNVFVDVNGDGLLDLISKAEVIINRGTPNLTQPPSQ